MLIYQDAEIEQTINDMFKEIMARNENAIRNESNLEIVNFLNLTILSSRFEPLTASHFRNLPPFLEKNEQSSTLKIGMKDVLHMQFYLPYIHHRGIRTGRSNI